MDKFIFSSGIIYEFTINPDDKHQFVNKRDSRVTNVKSAITDIFESTQEGFKYHLYPEISMPQYGNCSKNRYCRVHYHGICTFRTDTSLRSFLMYTWHKLTGMASIQFNEYRPDHWDEYCRKQKHLFRKHERICNATWDAVKKQL